MKKRFILLTSILISIIILSSIAYLDGDSDSRANANLSENFYSKDLSIALSFSNKIELSSQNKITKTIDKNLGLYVTNNGKDFTYIGETGIQGKDPNIIYENGVFYVATTRYGDANGNITVNIFKSTDLVNWTNVLDKSNTLSYPYKYTISQVPNNKHNLKANTYSPKWFKDNGKLYLFVSTSRFTENAELLYYIKSDTTTLKSNGLDTSPETLQNLNINPKLGILIKEYADIDNQTGEINRDSNNNIITKKSYYTNESGNAIQSNCPWYRPNYPLLDTYILEVNLGSEEEQKNINYQNLTFANLQKINFYGFENNSLDGRENKYAKSHSIICNDIIKNNNEKYPYTMYVKTEPSGTVQRWISKTLTDSWYLADDRFYLSDKLENPEDEIKCSSIVQLAENKHFDRIEDHLDIQTKNPASVYSKHFDGSFLECFGNNTYLYSNHYVITSKDEIGEIDDSDYLSKINEIAGIYYSVLDKNTKNSRTDLGIDSDHIKFNTFKKINTLNMDMRPSNLKENQLCDGTIYKLDKDSDIQSKENLKEIIDNASKFKLTVLKSNLNPKNGKITVVVKSNRAIKNKDSSENYFDWYNSGWKYVSEIKNDIDVDPFFRKIFTQCIDGLLPYGVEETYLYKTFDKNIDETLNLTDMVGNEQSITIN